MDGLMGAVLAIGVVMSLIMGILTILRVMTRDVKPTHFGCFTDNEYFVLTTAARYGRKGRKHFKK